MLLKTSYSVLIFLHVKIIINTFLCNKLEPIYLSLMVVWVNDQPGIISMGF